VVTGAGPPPVGFIIPSSNTVAEPELCRLASLPAAAPAITPHFSRVRVHRIALDDAAAGQFAVPPMLEAAAGLADAGVSAVVWAGTAGSWLGREHDLRLTRALESSLGVPATTATLALLQACAVFGVESVHLVTPYASDVAAQITRQYEADGLHVASERHLGLSDNRSFANVTADTLNGLIADAAAGADATLVCCTNLRAAPLAASLEAVIGRPVFDSVAACLWAALGRLDHAVPVPGSGALLRHGFLRAGLQPVCERLLGKTGADRVTVRADVPALVLAVDYPAAEAARGGVPRISRDGSLDQRRLETVRWLERRRTLLIQPSFTRPPFPPAALLGVYGVRAQMLAPIETGGALTGWVSVHSLTERDWAADDVTALRQAARDVATVLPADEGTRARASAGAA
jgi:maleate isomerase